MSESASPPRSPRKASLALRLVLALVVGVAAIFGGMALWNVQLQRRHTTEMIHAAATRYSLLIRNATHDGMLANDADRLHRVIQALGRSDPLQRIRVLDRDGEIRYATDPELMGHVPLEAFQCQICHQQTPLPSELADAHRMRIVELPGRGRFLNVVEPIPNEPACWTASCHEHPQDRRILGIIDIEIPLAPMEALIADSQAQLGVGLVATTLAIGLLAGLLVWRMVVRPVRQLAAATGRVAAGDFTATVPVGSRDEIGQAAASWNAMVAELGKVHGELGDWSRTLEQRVEAQTRAIEAAHQRMLVVEKMASLGKLAAVMAHEINNPLAGIATYARLMRRKVEKAEGEGRTPDPETRKVLELMESEATRCGRIVRNLLLFSRTPGARFADEDLGPILERCALLVHHQADLQEIAIHIEVDPRTPAVSCDASQVQQGVLALVMNAIEAMPRGGTLRMGARPAPEAGWVLLEVEDTGVGIRAEDLPRIFEPFHTTKEQGQGVGLGLSVVYGIVQRHHGRVDVQSEVGQGTTFTVRLPVRQPREAAADEDQRPEEAPTA